MNLKIQDLLLNSKDFRLRYLEDEKDRLQYYVGGYVPLQYNDG